MSYFLVSGCCCECIDCVVHQRLPRPAIDLWGDGAGILISAVITAEVLYHRPLSTTLFSSDLYRSSAGVAVSAL